MKDLQFDPNEEHAIILSSDDVYAAHELFEILDIRVKDLLKLANQLQDDMRNYKCCYDSNLTTGLVRSIELKKEIANH